MKARKTIDYLYIDRLRVFLAHTGMFRTKTHWAIIFRHWMEWLSMWNRKISLVHWHIIPTPDSCTLLMANLYSNLLRSNHSMTFHGPFLFYSSLLMNGLLKIASMETVFEAMLKPGLCADKCYDSKKLLKGVNNYFMRSQISSMRLKPNLMKILPDLIRLNFRI